MKKLFDDVDDDDVEKISKIEVDKEFAKRYEHNKKREELQKLEEMEKKGLVPDSGSDSESDTDSESEVVDVVKAAKEERKLLEALMKVRNKDPSLKQQDSKLFESSSDEEDEDEGEGRREKKKKKPKYLKDVIAEQLIERGPEYEEEEEREVGRVKSYNEEQKDLRKEVLKAMAEAEGEGGGEDEGELLWEKKRDEEEEEEGEDDEELNKKLDEYFGEDDTLGENDVFLKNYLKEKLWIDSDKGKSKVNLDELAELSDDEEAIEKQEEYEKGFNFRFEENASDRVLGHSRIVDGSVRKETNARKNQRERKKERLAQAEIERQEEVKRLKNLKRKEIQEKLSKIKEIAGIDKDIPLDEDDLEEDFDPEKFDKKMNAAFGDRYYEEEDVDPEFGSESESDLEKPDFKKEDELLGLPEDWDVTKSNDGFFAERERLKSIAEDGSDVDGGEDDDEQVDEGKKKRKRKKPAIKEALDKKLEEELYKLDYEDSIGDLKTRFKYREVKPSKYGLSAADILMLDEQELNQYVSLKKLATYREKEWKVPQIQKKMFFEKVVNDKMNQKKRKRRDKGDVRETNNEKESVDAGKAQSEEPSVDESQLSRAARRRRRMKEKKLPESRLVAYGKVPSSSKNKSKS
ncbi:protein KRI1 homolog [Chenopodium quinoa]|uniref:protein KRI1 homolog n=1 Tax=Chenopodium quinoa TaxID=63459 RepID=UPI000B7786C1|nr:protein KRI1 homolog [Chenopodium quinoa]XP_021716670.1 protein KRI1 homolog [Chenopodium quinoa]